MAMFFTEEARDVISSILSLIFRIDLLGLYTLVSCSTDQKDTKKKEKRMSFEKYAVVPIV